MEMNLFASSVLIGIGAAVMLVNIISHRHTMKATVSQLDVDREQTRNLVRIHHVLMGFFFVGYLVVLYLFINKIELQSNLFVAIIFFFGAVFVFLSIFIEKKMFAILKMKSERLEADKQRLTELNERLNQEITERKKAEDSDQMKSDFLSLVSHELRTPLTSIFGFTKLIDKRLSSLDCRQDDQAFNGHKAKIADNLSIVSAECSRLTRLINNVLDLARIESGQMDWEDRDISIQDILDSAMNALAGVLSLNNDVTVSVELDEKLPRVELDPDLFTQVVINIVSNAIKFTEAGEVRVTGRLREDGIRLSIQDQGRGIPADSLEAIFDKFHVVRTGDTLGEKRQGTGLGLPICKQIVTHYGGRIWAESVMEKGSTFHIWLPDSVYAAS